MTTRTEKYRLDHILIELENIVSELCNYCEIRKTFDSMFDNPINHIQELIGEIQDMGEKYGH